jgi:hypothetical protein
MRDRTVLEVLITKRSPTYQHHDALEFSNGAIVLVTALAAGQRATVLQLPTSPIEEKPQTSQPAARYESANA